ncbi:hypothetical protein GPECTOR_1g370 [Gonium pectorale]|uniref:ABC transporter domain-containing protein n=1 Tax=Gonium pectorale TaxID=33097 RepID=A0A150H2L4_GONPE|nr:hypothetical protein GPECTOR_1g370 [Gonium pectorale]|eukprot:KXZ56416.1 hypothetical protein GPECTOR_1g370 [Gonium pectorale]
MGLPAADQAPLFAAMDGPAHAPELTANNPLHDRIPALHTPGGGAGGGARRTFTADQAGTLYGPAVISGSGRIRFADGTAGDPLWPRHRGGGAAARAHQPMEPVEEQAPVAPDPWVVRRVSSQMRRISIEWIDLGCEYDTATGPKTVLEGVYGRAEPGDLLGLLGPSGAGKSTLLDVLAARKRVGRLSGRVLVDGKPRDDGAFVRRSAYVPQDDHFMPVLTAGEVLSFFAALVLPTSSSRKGRRSRCAEVLEAMGLGRQANTLVGGALPGGLSIRGLSGGERKRLAIATGIVAAPSCLLLDEPTSGLDAAAALGVMQYMRALADAGHVVLASVHQPRAAIWAMFTQVVVLSCGRMMYSGDRTGAVPWFSARLGYTYDPQRHGVASDWIMDLVNTTFKKPRRVYGRMMTSKADVDRAAEQYLKQYRKERRAGSLPGDGTASEQATTDGEEKEEVMPLYDSLDRARAASSAATAAAAAAAAAAGEGAPPIGHLGGARASGGGGGGGGGALSGHSALEINDTAGAPATAPAPQHRRGILKIQGSGTAAAASKGDDDKGGAVAAARAAAEVAAWGARRHKQAAPPGWLRQVRALFWRELLSMTRNPADVAGRMLIFCWIALVVGIIFYGIGDYFESVRSRTDVMFIEVCVLLLLPYVYMSLYTADKQYYMADLGAKLYHPSAYYVAKVLAVLPFGVLSMLVFSFTIYGMAGLRKEVGPLAEHGVMCVLAYLIASQVLYAAAIATPNQDTAFMVAIAWTAVNILMSNYLAAEYRGRVSSCSSGFGTPVLSVLPEYLPGNPALHPENYLKRLLGTPGPDCTVDTNLILRYFGMREPFWRLAVILLGYLGVLHLITYAALRLTAGRERR